MKQGQSSLTDFGLPRISVGTDAKAATKAMTGIKGQ
jgi:hypothetical protein